MALGLLVAKWVVNTVEDFVDVEADYMSVIDGTLYASTEVGPPIGRVNAAAFAPGFWLSFYMKKRDADDQLSNL